MASSAEVDSWKALGGRIEQKKFIAPTGEGCDQKTAGLALFGYRSISNCAGEKYSSWDDAAKYLTQHVTKGKLC